jgi:hypothetical protein
MSELERLRIENALYREAMAHLTEGINALKASLTDPKADFSWEEDWTLRGEALARKAAEALQ